jgi:hypothetical protein
MQLKFFLAASAASVSLACGLAAPAHAQETTSSISGSVMSDAGAVAGAAVSVTHIPSGTTATTTTDASGNYELRGLRVGGPYTVTVNAPGVGTQSVEGVTTVVGDSTSVPISLSSAEIVVTAARAGSRALVEGSQSSFNAADIADIVSARRDVRDIVRRDLLAAYNPNVGGVTIAGGNIRTQRFSVDGVQMQDSFGLNYGGLPSTRGIVSIEAIDQLTVKAAPFDISEGNFQGGAVNVVLKSGTNNYHGSAFGNFGGPGLTGDRTRDNRDLFGNINPVGPSIILPFRNYGGSLSGPIIKDKLFLSLAYEQLSEGAPNTYAIQGGSAPNIVTAITAAQVTDVLSRYSAAGYDKHEMGNVPTAIEETDKKYSAKLDWNVTDGHRVAVSYIHHENSLANFANGSATGSTSSTTPNISLQSNLYGLNEFTNAISGQYNAQWNDSVSSEIRVAYKYYKRGQDSYFGPDYAQFAVCLDGTSQGGFYPAAAAALCSTGTGIIRLGPDAARQANAFNNKSLTITTNVQARVGDHTLKIGYDRFQTDLYNLFVYGGSIGANTTNGNQGGSQGTYYFDSLADFSARNANEYTLTTTTTGNKLDGNVDWGYVIHTFGFQDTWKPSRSFTANFGVRTDVYDMKDRPTFNPNFSARFASVYPGLINNSTYNGRIKIQPRAGFNWSPSREFRISGGAGLFAGGLSDVFMSNNFSNSGAAINSTGAIISSIDILRTGGTAAAPTCVNRLVSATTPLPAAICAAALNNVAGGTVPTVLTDYIKNNAALSATTSTNELDPNFKMPAQWKGNLALAWNPVFGDGELGTGWHFRADALYSKVQQNIRWIDVRALPLVVNGVAQVAPDGRPRYGGALPGNTNPTSNSDIMLTNTDKGRSIVLAAGFTKDVGDVFQFGASYTHQDVKDVSGILVSSTVGSSYSVATSDPNGGGDYGRSSFETTHTVRANWGFKKKFFGDNETRFGLNWELRSGQPFSLTMIDGNSTGAGCPVFAVGGTSSGRVCAFGTTNNSSHLWYVPDFNAAAVTTASTTQGVAGTLTQYGNVIFADAATLASVKSLVQGNEVLSKYQGKILPKNVLNGPWYNKVDLNFAQQLPFVRKSKITLLASIENALNLINRNWGTYQDYSDNSSVVRVACQAAANPTAAGAQTCPNYIYSSFSTPRTSVRAAKYSLYAIRVGARLDF